MSNVSKINGFNITAESASYATSGNGSFTGSFTGSFIGTASFALNGGVTQLIAGTNISLSPAGGTGAVTITSTGGGGESFRIISGSVIAQVNTVNDLFLVKSASIDLFKIQSDRVIVVATQSAELSNPAPNGGIYFTSGSFFVGLD
jgi:hypothetical protein